MQKLAEALCLVNSLHSRLLQQHPQRHLSPTRSSKL
jgi:hypothetical protein